MSISRNVVILGKAGSGKRTLGNHIVGGDIFERETVLGKRNVDAYYGEVRSGRTFYRILTVVIKSLQTGYNNPIPHIERKFQEIHSIIFAIPLHGCNTDEQHGSLMHAIEMFPQQAKSVSALVITQCERMTDEQRKAVIAKFAKFGSLQVVAYMQHGIHAVGFPDLSTLPSDEKPILHDRDEEAIRKLVERCKVPLSAKSLSGSRLGVQQSHYNSSSATTALPSEVMYKKPSSESPKRPQKRTMIDDHERPLIDLEPHIPATKTPANADLVNVSLSAKNLLGLGSQQPPRPRPRPSATAAFQTQVMCKQPYSVPSPEQPRQMAYQIVRNRCVVIMGKSGAGKSTVANQLVGHDPLSRYDPPFGVSTSSVAREVKHQVVEFKRGNVLYRVTVIDTVGLFDPSIEGQDPIFDKIEEYFKDYIEGINLILFVFKKGRFTAEEQEVFSFIRSKFETEISPISALAVTGCENDTTDGRTGLVHEFLANEDTKRVASQMKMGIHPVGFPPLKTYIPQLQPVYKEKMEKDREALRELIINAEELLLTKKLFAKKVKTSGCTVQ